MPSAADKKKGKKNAANLLSSNPRSPAVPLHPFSRLLRAAAVAPCLLSVLEVSGVRLSWAAAFNGNCRSPHCSREQNAQFYFHRAFIYFHRSLLRRHSPAATTQRELHAPDSRMQHAAIVWRMTKIIISHRERRSPLTDPVTLRLLRQHNMLHRSSHRDLGLGCAPQLQINSVSLPLTSRKLIGKPTPRRSEAAGCSARRMS